MSSSLNLRPAAAEDAPRVADVLLSSRGEFLPYAPLAHTEPEVRRWIADMLIPSGGVTVACEEGVVVGMLAVSEDPECHWIDQLYVAPGCVGRGIGSALLRQTLSTLTKPVRLYTFQANTRACRFYERFGFWPIEFTDGSGNEERCPDVLYERRVTASAKA